MAVSFAVCNTKQGPRCAARRCAVRSGEAVPVVDASALTTGSRTPLFRMVAPEPTHHGSLQRSYIGVADEILLCLLLAYLHTPAPCSWPSDLRPGQLCYPEFNPSVLWDFISNLYFSIFLLLFFSFPFNRHA